MHTLASRYYDIHSTKYAYEIGKEVVFVNF